MAARGGGSIVTMTYLGGERAVPTTTSWALRRRRWTPRFVTSPGTSGEVDPVNAISAGPVRTLAARSIAGFPTMESIVEERSPLRRNIDAGDVANAAAYLLGGGERRDCDDALR